MCLPAAVGAVLGAVSSAAGAVGQFQSGQAANANAMASYKHQIEQREHDWRMQLSTWAHRRLEYKKDIQSNDEAASRGYTAEQTRLNEAFQAAAFQKQDQLVALLGSQGILGEKQGKSAARLNQSMLAQFGRNNATIAANLSSARNAMIQRQEDIRRQMMSANNKAYSEVALQPIAGIAPPKPVLSNPGIGLIAGLAGAAASGIKDFNKGKAPDAGNLTPPPRGGDGASWGDAFNYKPQVPFTIPPNHFNPKTNSLGANFANSYNYQY